MSGGYSDAGTGRGRLRAAATDASVLEGTQYEFTPSSLTFAAPVSLTIRYPSSLPARVKESRLALCPLVDGVCVPMNGNARSATSRTVTNSILPLGGYGVTPYPEMCYMSTSNGGTWLHTDAGEIPLPACMGDISSPPRTGAWSPDGSKLVYCSASCWGYGWTGTPGELRVVNADGTLDHALITANMPTPGGGTFIALSCPLYSSDGGKILFSWGGGGLALMNADGTGVNDFFGTTTAPGCGQMMSPDGQRIMALGGVPYEANLVSMDLDGSHRKFLLPTGGYSKLLGWSADGNWFAFYASSAGSSPVPGLYVTNKNGSSVTLVAPYSREASWSPIPGDNRLVYVTGTNDYGDCYCDPPNVPPPGVYIVDPNASHRTLVIDGNGPRFPRWSPDALRIAIQWYYGPLPIDPGGNPHTTYLVNPDGSGFQWLMGPTWRAVNAMWRP